VCQEKAYLMELVRYIHLNLLRAGIVKDMTGLNRSPWSGHSVLLGNKKREWHNTEYVLSCFGSKKNAEKIIINMLKKEWLPDTDRNWQAGD
jgi:putative transposase